MFVSGAWRPFNGSQFTDFGATIDLEYRTDNRFSSGKSIFHCGIEYWLAHIFAMRMGYQNANDLNDISFGLGIRYGMVQVDYAMCLWSQ